MPEFWAKKTLRAGCANILSSRTAAPASIFDKQKYQIKLIIILYIINNKRVSKIFFLFKNGKRCNIHVRDKRVFYASEALFFI